MYVRNWYKTEKSLHSLEINSYWLIGDQVTSQSFCRIITYLASIIYIPQNYTGSAIHIGLDHNLISVLLVTFYLAMPLFCNEDIFC